MESACEAEDVIQILILAGDDGLYLDLTSVGLMVVEIKPGAVQRHNENIESDVDRVRVHDIVVSVDDETDPHNMLQIFANRKQYALEVVHTRETKVRIPKETGKLGLGLRHTPGSIVIQVDSVGPGDAQRYNETAEPSQQVYEKCLIGAVNGMSGSPQHMLTWLKRSKEHVDLTLHRRVVEDLTIVPADLKSNYSI